MPSVLILGEYGSLNGGENSLLAALPFLQQAGWEVSAAVPSDSEFSRVLESCDVTVYPLWFNGLGGERLSQSQIRSSFANLIRETDPDLVHANSLSTARLLGPVAKELEIKASGHLRDIVKCSAKAIEDLNCLDRIIAVSKATSNFHASQGLDESRLTVIYNGVDTTLFCPAEPGANFEQPVRQELGLPEDSFLALFVGQIGMRKGIDWAIETMSAPMKQHPDVHLLFVGERHSQKEEAIEYEANCRAMAKQLGEGRVHWLGRRDEIFLLMQQCDMLVHMAKQEPLGRVLLEAAATGLPILTTDVGGTREILSGLEELIVSERTSFVDCFDFHSYREAKFVSRIGKALRELATTRFKDENAGKLLAEEFAKVIE